MDVTTLDSEEEKQERFNVIKNTCAKDRNTADVSGREKLLEGVNNDEDVLVTILKAFKPLGYFKGSSSKEYPVPQLLLRKRRKKKGTIRVCSTIQ